MVGELYSVDPQIQWSRTSGENLEMWTVNGPALEAVYFVNGIEEGASLVKSSDSKRKLPVFRKHMRPTEVQELVVDTIKAADDSASLEPAQSAEVRGPQVAGLHQTRAHAVGANHIQAHVHGFQRGAVVRCLDGIHDQLQDFRGPHVLTERRQLSLCRC